jgi:cystathionine gamma-synthase
MTPPRKPATVAAAARPDKDPAYGALVAPIWSTDTFRWDDADTKPEYDYSRTVNPNRDLLVGALAELEGASGGAVTGSGQSAALLALLLLPADALVVAPHDCYGGTYRLLRGLEEQGKLSAIFVDLRDDAAFGEAVGKGPDLVWIETPSNPLLRLTDIASRAAEAKAAGALVLADNTLPTPCRQQPLALGCDLVLHSTTKALNGHADLFGGALLAADPALVEKLIWWANAAGLSGSAHDSAQILRGLRTLTLRIDRQEASAGRIAEWLAGHGLVRTVNYPGLPSHPDHALAGRQQSGCGFMISFRLEGGESAVRGFLAALELITLASSLGGFATLICKPSTMTHRGMPPEAQARAGIAPDLLRLSVGLEDSEDLIADLTRGFAAIDAAIANMP